MTHRLMFLLYVSRCVPGIHVLWPACSQLEVQLLSSCTSNWDAWVTSVSPWKKYVSGLLSVPVKTSPIRLEWFLNQPTSTHCFSGKEEWVQAQQPSNLPYKIFTLLTLKLFPLPKLALLISIIIITLIFLNQNLYFPWSLEKTSFKI